MHGLRFREEWPARAGSSIRPPGHFAFSRVPLWRTGKMGYSRGAFKLNVFSNIVDAEAPNLLVPDARTGEPLQLNFKTRERSTMFEAGNVNLIGRRQALSYGGNYRRNNFNITLTPAAEDRNEIAQLPPGRNLRQLH